MENVLSAVAGPEIQTSLGDLHSFLTFLQKTPIAYRTVNVGSLGRNVFLICLSSSFSRPLELGSQAREEW